MVNYSQDAQNAPPTASVLVCVNQRMDPGKPSCAGRGSREFMAELRERLHAEGMAIEVREVFCFGRCELGPNLRITPGGRFFHGADAQTIDELIAALRGD